MARMPKEFAKWWRSYLAASGFGSASLISQQIRPLKATLDERKKFLKTVSGVSASIVRRQIRQLDKQIKRLEGHVLTDDIGSAKRAYDSLMRIKKVKQVKMVKGYLVVVTDMLYFDGVPSASEKIGKFAFGFRVPVSWYNLVTTMLIRNLSYRVSGYHHCHVNSSGGLCTGEYNSELNNAFNGGKLVELITALIDILETSGLEERETAYVDRDSWKENKYATNKKSRTLVFTH